MSKPAWFDRFEIVDYTPELQEFYEVEIPPALPLQGLLLVQDQNLAAVALYDPGHQELVGLWVCEACRRQGIGTYLVEHLPAVKMVQVDPQNSIAIAFYEKLGFWDSGVLINYLGKYDSLLMLRNPKP